MKLLDKTVVAVLAFLMPARSKTVATLHSRLSDQRTIPFRTITAVALSVAAIACDRNPIAPGHFPPVGAPSQAPSVPPANIAGTYIFTLSAATSCSNLPQYARTHDYLASIVQAAGSNSAAVKVSDNDFKIGFGASVIGDTVWLNIDASPLSDCSSWFEKLQPKGFLFVCGSAKLKVDATTFGGTLNGTIGYVGDEALSGDYSKAVNCQATHTVSFRRK